MKGTGLVNILKYIKEQALGKKWLEFLKLWGMEEDFYISVGVLREGFEDLKKVVSPKTVLKIGADDLEAFLGAVLEYLGTDELHNAA